MAGGPVGNRRRIILRCFIQESKVMKEDTHTDLVSVIVPVYNSEKYLRLCVESIIKQTYKNIELILINDGSTDNSGEICHGYVRSDDRVKVIYTPNKGPAAARNIGIENSRGDFLFFVDSDDVIANNALSLLIKRYRQTNADLIVGDFKIENYKTGSTGAIFLFSSDKLLAKQDIIDYARSYLKKPTGYSIFIYAWGKLFRSSIIKGNNIYFNTNLRVFEDISFIFDYLKFASSACYVKNHIYKYFVNNGPASAGMKIYDNAVGYKLALKSIGEFLKCNGIDASIIKKEIGHACISFTIRIMVRFFVLRGNVSLKHIYRLIFNMINDSDIRNNLQFYSPGGGDSRIIPILMKLKLVWLIILVCKYKALRGYKRRVDR